MTNLNDRQNELKLDMLESLARSQRALSVILESLAGITEVSESAAQTVQKNIAAIARYQGVLAARLAGFRISVKKNGAPASPWLNPALPVTSLRRSQ